MSAGTRIPFEASDGEFSWLPPRDACNYHPRIESRLTSWKGLNVPSLVVSVGAV